MYCKYCGAKIDDNDEYCKYCGSKQSTTDGIDMSSSQTLHNDNIGEGRAYHTPDIYEDIIDPFSEDEEVAESSLHHYSSNDSLGTSNHCDDKCNNPFDREIRKTIGDVETDEVKHSYTNGYKKTNGKNKAKTPPHNNNTTYNAGAYFVKHDNISEHDRTLAIITLVMAFVFPFAGIVLGRRFYRNVSHLTNPDPYYMKIAKIGLIISYVDVAFWLLGCIVSVVMVITQIFA